MKRKPIQIHISVETDAQCWCFSSGKIGGYYSRRVLFQEGTIPGGHYSVPRKIGISHVPTLSIFIWSMAQKDHTDGDGHLQL